MTLRKFVYLIQKTFYAKILIISSQLPHTIMNRFFSFLIFTFVTAFVCFAVMSWGFHTDTNEAVGGAMGAALGGLIVETFRRYRVKKSDKQPY